MSAEQIWQNCSDICPILCCQEKCSSRNKTVFRLLRGFSETFVCLFLLSFHAVSVQPVQHLRFIPLRNKPKLACLMLGSAGHVEIWEVYLLLVCYLQVPITPFSVSLHRRLCARTFNSSLMPDDTTSVSSVSQKMFTISRWCWWWILCKLFNLRGRIGVHPTALQS